MKQNDPLGRYPYRCPDCLELRPFKSRVKYARHRAARHSVVVTIPEIEERGRHVLEPLPLYLPEPGGLAHGTGALPTLDDYDGPPQW